MAELPSDTEPGEIPEKSNLPAHFFSKSEAPKKNVLIQFFEKIKQTFQGFKNEPDVKLSGRVQQFNQTSVIVLQKLKFIKEELKIKIDNELFAHVENLMDPMTRDALSIQKMIVRQSVVDQAKAYKRYSNWIAKAGLWVDLEAKIHDKQAVIDAMIQHIMHESDELIEQDLQVILDYKAHLLDSLSLSEEEYDNIQIRLEKEFVPHEKALLALKEKQAFKELGDVFHWKDEVDRLRAKHFDRALYEIDKIIQEISPVSTNVEEHEHLIEVFAKIASLEEEIPQFLTEMTHADLRDPAHRNFFESRLAAFEEELNRLNLNLQLTPELFERVQALIDLLHN
jgi:hypothetical protein